MNANEGLVASRVTSAKREDFLWMDIEADGVFMYRTIATPNRTF
jgi:hypothetical protein